MSGATMQYTPQLCHSFCTQQVFNPPFLAFCLLYRYLMEPMDQIRQELKDDMGRLSDEVKRLNQQQQHAAKTLAATEAEVQELFKSNPELARQLMPVSS